MILFYSLAGVITLKERHKFESTTLCPKKRHGRDAFFSKLCTKYSMGEVEPLSTRGEHQVATTTTLVFSPPRGPSCSR